MPTKVTLVQTAPDIKVGGRQLPAAAYNSLMSLHVERELNLVGRTVIRFHDSGYQLSASPDFKMGTTVTIALRENNTTVFTGVITGASLEQSSGQSPELVVVVDEVACKLGLQTKVVAHTNKKYSEIVRPMAQAIGLTASMDFGPMDTVVHKYLLQRASDLAFLDTIVRRANCVWWIDDGELHVAPVGDAGKSVELSLERDLMDFSVRASGLRPTKVKVNGWDIDAQQDITVPDQTPQSTASSAFVNGYTGDGPKQLGAGELLAGDGNPNVSTEAGALASSLSSAWHSSAVVARGTMLASVSVSPATEVKITDAGPSSGTYTVSRVEHVFRGSGFITKFVAGPMRPSGLVDTLGSTTPDVGFTMPGLITGLVSDAKDPDGHGRVKVKYTGAGGELASDWARVVSLGGGSSRGSYFLPEVGDEVLVGFERGDARHPVVLGGLFSAKFKIAGDGNANGSDGKIEYRRITSRLGHVFEFGDGDGPDKQHMVMALKGEENKIRLGADKTTIDVKKGNTFTLTAGEAKIAIDAQGNITIEGASIKLKSKMTNIELEAQAELKAKSTAGMTLEGAMIDVKAQSNASLQGNAMTTIKGGVVMIN